MPEPLSRPARPWSAGLSGLSLGPNVHSVCVCCVDTVCLAGERWLGGDTEVWLSLQGMASQPRALPSSSALWTIPGNPGPPCPQPQTLAFMGQWSGDREAGSSLHSRGCLFWGLCDWQPGSGDKGMGCLEPVCGVSMAPAPVAQPWPVNR